MSKILTPYDLTVAMLKTTDAISNKLSEWSNEMEHVDPILSFGEAIELCKKGVPVACTSMSADEFVVLTPTQLVVADKFWNEHNRNAALRNGGSLVVCDYFMKTNSYSTVPYTVTNENIFTDWVKADTERRLVNIKITKDEDNDDAINLFFKPIPKEHQDAPTPFWVAYDELNMNDDKVVVIGTYHRSMALLASIIDIMITERKTRDNSLHSISVKKDVKWEDLQAGFTNILNVDPALYCNDGYLLEENILEVLEKYKHYGYGETLGKVQFVVDVDTLIGLVAHDGTDLREYITTTLNRVTAENPNINWCCMSVEETLAEFSDVPVKE